MLTFHPRVVLALTSAVSLLVLVLPPGAASAGPSERADPGSSAAYVALGDSYSSGTGAGAYADDGTTCLRSAHAFPSLIAARRGLGLDFRACSGALVADVRRLQLDALGSETRFVTISVGGNDAGFAAVLSACATPWWLGDCDRAVDGARAFIRDTLPGRLDGLYGDIEAAAPQAEVSVVGYPRLFNGEDCNPLTFFSTAEMLRLNHTANLTDRVVASAAAEHGFDLADPRKPFVGHAVCAAHPWLHGLTAPVEESFHPTRRGHARGDLPVVETFAPAGTSALRTPSGHLPAAAIAEQQLPYAARDAAIEPEVVRVPDLRTARARAAARREGIHLGAWLARHTPTPPDSAMMACGGPDWGP